MATDSRVPREDFWEALQSQRSWMLALHVLSSHVVPLTFVRWSTEKTLVVSIIKEVIVQIISSALNYSAFRYSNSFLTSQWCQHISSNSGSKTQIYFVICLIKKNTVFDRFVKYLCFLVFKAGSLLNLYILFALYSLPQCITSRTILIC